MVAAKLYCTMPCVLPYTVQSNLTLAYSLYCEVCTFTCYKVVAILLAKLHLHLAQMVIHAIFRMIKYSFAGTM